MIEKAIQIALKAHAGQLDKAGRPYILHPLRVMMKMDTDIRRVIAVLHDVIEDSDWTLQELFSAGFTAEVVSALDRLTRRDGQSYSDFLVRIAGDTNAIAVKIADLEDNLDVTRLRVIFKPDFERINKYLDALAALKEVL